VGCAWLWLRGHTTRCGITPDYPGPAPPPPKVDPRKWAPEVLQTRVWSVNQARAVPHSRPGSEPGQELRETRPGSVDPTLATITMKTRVERFRPTRAEGRKQGSRPAVAGQLPLDTGFCDRRRRSQDPTGSLLASRRIRASLRRCAPVPPGVRESLARPRGRAAGCCPVRTATILAAQCGAGHV